MLDESSADPVSATSPSVPRMGRAFSANAAYDRSPLRRRTAAKLLKLATLPA
jgi:hypothetical protein